MNNVDLLKKILLTGLGAALMTEEGIRNAVSDISLPRDVRDFLIKQAKNRIPLEQLLQKVLDGMEMEVAAVVRFRPTKDKRPSRIKIKTIKIK